MNARTAVQSVAADLGYGSRTYASQVESIAAAFERGETDSTIQSTLVSYGATRSTAVTAVSRVRELLADTETTTEDASFDRATAASVIRAFIQNGEHHVGDRGASKEDVDALLILAGLEDEPEPEPLIVGGTEVEPGGLIARLVDWARRNGFAG